MDQANRIRLSFAALLIGCAALAAAVPRVWSTEPMPVAREHLRNLSSAATIEIVDASGRAVLKGALEALTTTPGDVLKAAPLITDETSAVGKAEIELVRHPNGTLVQELEVDVDGLPGDAVFHVLVDGERTGSFRTDAFGGAELERYGRVAQLTARAGD